MAISSAKSIDARVSFKDSIIVSRELKNLRLTKAKQLLNSLLNGKASIDGKYYSNTTKKFLEVLNAAEANARQKNLNTENLFVKIAKADKARRFIRPKSRLKFRGREAKGANIEIVLEER